MTGLDRRRPIRHRIRDFVCFCKRFAKHPTRVGALVPSSGALASAIAGCIESQRHPQRVLEVGAGTGVFTRKILERLAPSDTLDIVDIDPKFCGILHRRFSHVPNVRIHHTSVVAWNPPAPYDHIVSGLPLNNFAPDDAAAIFEKIRALLGTHGKFSYFEYVFLPFLRNHSRRLVKREGRRSFLRTLQIKRAFKHGFRHRRERIVWANIPPARVITCWNK